MNQSIPRRISIEFDTFSKLKFLDRIRIMIGYNIVARVKINVDKRTGQAWQACHLGLTTAVSAEQVVQAQHRDSIAMPEERGVKAKDE